MFEPIRKFQNVLYLILLIFLGLVLVVSIINLGFTVVILLINENGIILETQEIIQIFGYFLLVLIGIEFFESILTYLRDSIIHVEIIIMVALTAVARKIILIDPSVSDMHLIGLGVLILSLGVAYYLIRKSNRGNVKENIMKPNHQSE